MPTNNFKASTVDELNKRLVELQEQAISLETPTAELEKIAKEQSAIWAEIRNKKESRSNELANIATKIKAFNFTIKEIFGDYAIDLFNDADMSQAAQVRGLLSTKAPRVEKEKSKEPRGKKMLSDDNPVFIHIPGIKIEGKRGAAPDFVFKQGRANEFYQGKSMLSPSSLAKPLARIVGKTMAETEKNLLDYADETYAKTDAGKNELKKLAEFAFKFVQKENEKTPTEPHNEAQAEMQGKAS